MSRRMTSMGAWAVLLWGCFAGRAEAAEAQWPGRKPVGVARKAFATLQVVDHWNLRYHKEYDDFTLAEQVAQIKRNMDVFSKLGFTEYLLFQKDAFRELLTWGGTHEPDQELRQAVGEVIAHGKARGMRVFLHSNQFLWPEDAGVPYGDTARAWALYRGAMQELVRLFPDLGGYEVTADETGGMLRTREGVVKFHNETARALGPAHLALMRTWQRVGGFMGSPARLGQDDEPNVLFSVKNTSEDFRCTSGFDGDFFEAVGQPERLIVEFDAWREHETHNVFPLYLGDYWAPRIRALAEKGVQRLALRANWNSGHFPITERPWANWVNVFAFVRLAENPQADPDDILREFVALYFPPAARDTAFHIYKSSFDYARSLYYSDGGKITDHGRVNRRRKLGGKSVPDDWLSRVDARFEAMLAKIDGLPDEGAWKQELRRGARAVAYVSKACGAQLGARGDLTFLAEWKRTDPESFDELRGRYALGLLRSEARRRAADAELPLAPAVAGPGVHEAESAALINASAVRRDDEDYWKGGTGDAYVDFEDGREGAVAWRIRLEEGGRYRLAFRYALDDDEPRPLRLTVNGKVVARSLPFTDTGDWDAWKSVRAETMLRKGKNTLRLESTGRSGPNLDHMAIEKLGELPADAPAPAPPAPRPRTLRRGDTTLALYPPSPIRKTDGKITGTVQGHAVLFDSFRTSSQYYYDVSYAWFAADGPVDVALKVNAQFERARVRTIGKDIPFLRRGSTLDFTLPGPGHYYVPLPDLGQPQPGKPDSGTYTVLFLVDDLESLRATRMDPDGEGVTVVPEAGVVSDREKDQTAALQGVIGRRGNVYVPAGVYRTAKLRVPSNTTLYLAPGAVIQATDGDVGKSAPFLDLRDSENVRIHGPGIIDGNGKPYHLVQTERSRDVTLQDSLYRNCTSWAIHLLLVERAAVRNVRILSGKDGIDPDCAKDVTVEGCLVLSKDDSVAVKTRKPPATTERVTVRRCIVASDASALKIGTETRAPIRNVTFEDCEVFDSDRGIILYARDGGPIENVTWRNIRMQMIDWPHETRGAPFQFQISRRGGATPVRRCLVENVDTTCRVASSLGGLKDAPLDGLVMRNITLRVDRPAGNDRPPLFRVGRHVQVPLSSLTIHWQGNRQRWNGVLSGSGLDVTGVSQTD